MLIEGCGRKIDIEVDWARVRGNEPRTIIGSIDLLAKLGCPPPPTDFPAVTISTRRIGPALAFERVWEETGCRGVIERLAGARKHDFSLERAAFLTVLHRLFCGGSDRAADRWREDYRIDGVEGLDLHHLYRAMAWLGEELPEDQQDGATPFAPRCVKDVMEEDLFACRRDLLTTLDVVFMDTTSLYFEGAGGHTLGRRGFSKDHRPDLNQMILAVLLDGDGRPVCTEMWPGNTADVNSLIPAIDRLQSRFRINRVCVVADRGMISAEAIAELEARGLIYVPAPFVPFVLMKPRREVDYEAKAVKLAGRRYIVCRNLDEMSKERDGRTYSGIRTPAERRSRRIRPVWLLSIFQVGLAPAPRVVGKLNASPINALCG